MTSSSARYGAVAMALHWVIAVAIIGLIVVGKYMHGLSDTHSDKFWLYQLHKSFGITVLALTVVRIVWRLINPVPPFPASMATWQRWGAYASHVLLYALMLALPLSGWLRVSTDVLGIPTLIFGLFELPALPFGANDDLSHQAHDAHEIMGNAMILLLIVHVAAALKHHFWDRDDVLKRILPFTRVG